MLQPDRHSQAWLEDTLATFERFGNGWRWWNHGGDNIYRIGLAAAERVSPHVLILSKWARR